MEDWSDLEPQREIIKIRDYILIFKQEEEEQTRKRTVREVEELK